MPSSSGGGSRGGQNPSTNKLKPTSQNKSSGLNSEFTLVSYSRKSKAKSNPTSPVSPGLQQIMDNPPVLDTSNTAFNYNIPDNAHEPIMVDDVINGYDLILFISLLSFIYKFFNIVFYRTVFLLCLSNNC